MPFLRRKSSLATSEASKRSTFRNTASHLRRTISLLRRHFRRSEARGPSVGEKTERKDDDCTTTTPRYSGSETASLLAVSRQPLSHVLLSPSLASGQDVPWSSAFVPPRIRNGTPANHGLPNLNGTSSITAPTTCTAPTMVFLKLPDRLEVVDSLGRPLPQHEGNPHADIWLGRNQTRALSTRCPIARHQDTASIPIQRQCREGSPLPDLPNEVWTQIGKSVIDDMGLVDATTAQTRPRCLREAVRQPYITQTCRFLRQELLPYFYRKTLVIKMSMSCQKVANTWLAAIGPNNRRYLDNVYFVADREHHRMDPTTGATHRCGAINIIVGLTKVECNTLGLVAYYDPPHSRVYARKIKWLE